MRQGDDFRWMRVVSTTRISRSMQRLRLAGNSLHRFATPDNLHVRLYVPKDATDVPSGHPGETSLGEASAYAMRYYTIRHIDADAGWIDIDFVLHHDEGPGCRFALTAMTGDYCGMSGPCGRGIKPCGSCLLIGDDTALPAIGRICEAIAPNCIGRIVALTDDPVVMRKPEGMNVTRISPEQPPAAIAREIADLVWNSLLQDRSDEGFLWAAGEYHMMRTLQPIAAIMPTGRALVVPYWRSSALRS